MPQAELPPTVPPAIVCSISAAAAYGLPANIILAVADMEGGRPGLWVRNENGTYDVGPMQFNTAYLKTLTQYGITPAAVAADNCYPYQLAAWRLRKHIREDSGDLWTRIANYHSRSLQFNAPYRIGVIRRARYWVQWLSARFATYEMPSPVTTASGITPVVAGETRKPVLDVAATLLRTVTQEQRSIAIRESQGTEVASVPRTIMITESNEGGSVP